MEQVIPVLQDSSFTAEQNEQGRVVRKMYNGSGAAIPDGSAVVLDVEVIAAPGADHASIYGRGNAIKESPAVANSYGVGFADAVIPNGEWGPVLRKGIKLNANVATGTAAEAPLKDSATLGRADTGVIGTDRIIGMNLRLAAANLSDIYVDL
jgi:hypothetical protein